MSRFHTACTAIALLVSSVVVSPASAGEWEHARNGFTIGLGLGVGSAGQDVDGFESGDRAGGGAGAFRLGFAVSPKVEIGLESTAWLRQENEVVLGQSVDLTTTLTVTALAVTLFPNPQGGFLVRAGVGMGRLSEKLEVGSSDIEVSEDGFGVLLAAGYEWRLTRTFALGLEGDFGWFGLSDVELSDTAGETITADVSYDYVNLNVTTTWYFGS